MMMKLKHWKGYRFQVKIQTGSQLETIHIKFKFKQRTSIQRTIQFLNEQITTTMIIIMIIIDFNTESIIINAREIDKRQVSLSNDICYTKLKNWKGYRFQDKISNWKLVEMQLFLQRNTYRVTLAKFSKHSGIPAGKEQKVSGTGRGAVEEGGGGGRGEGGLGLQHKNSNELNRVV